MIMEDKSIKKLYRLCNLLENFCETHEYCDFCPFYDIPTGCKINSVTQVRVVELKELFPKNIVQEDEP